MKLLTEFAAESEGALEISKLQKLILVGTLYQPLIYGLTKTTDFKTLVELVSHVCGSLKNNPELPDSLVNYLKQ